MGNSNYKLKFSDDCLKTEVDNNLIILNTSSGKFLEVNATGKVIIKIIETNNYSANMVVERLKLDFEEENNLIEKDTLQFIKKAIEIGIIIENDKTDD
tara:strand:- start:36007 stop:36300 length:294 start_codon:yes stop_codon:yes gene_type:complete